MDNWMVRFDNDGLASGGFRWSPIGEWTEAPDWDPSPRCGGGLHGQGPGGFGYSQTGTRFVFCETGDEKVVIDGDKIKVKRARILAENEKAWVMLYEKCNGHFPGSITLGRYPYPLPVGLITIGGYCAIVGYPHALPDGLSSIYGDVFINECKYPLPNTLEEIGGNITLHTYNHPLPANLTMIGGYVAVEYYPYPLPEKLKNIGGALYLSSYKQPLPAGLNVGGPIRLGNYNLPLPSQLVNKIIFG